MFERTEPVLKVLCAALAAVLIFQVVRTVARGDSLAHLSIPALPTLPPDTNAPEGGARTNSLAGPGSGKAGTNTAQAVAQTNNAATNSPVVGSGKATTNNPLSASAPKGTNSPGQTAVTNAATNALAQLRLPASGTNTTVRPDSAGTNSSATTAAASKRGSGALPGQPPQLAAMGMGPPGMPGAMPAPELALPIRARVDRITDSELLGQVMHPLPMALLGIAGDVAFLRAANGQTGLVKEGDSLGGLKLLQIGINRVLVEDGGQKKELTIFSGLGGESLLPKQNEDSK
jgi:hypothetical protein